ncbi:MAG: GNAT family N-acetyltransferase [Verrucomicrobiales bacterium]
MTENSAAPGGRPVGEPLPDWLPPPPPSRETMRGQYCRLEALDPDQHAAALFDCFAGGGGDWLYLPYGPFGDFDGFSGWMRDICLADDPLFFAIISEADQAVLGVASFLRIAPSNGSIEVGHIHYSESLKRTPAATEAMFLMMRHAFELGYRRYEWKCDALNARSRAAAERLGLTYEGTFRQATIYKGRNRDTAWYATIDREWPALHGAICQWLDPQNFNADGQQLSSLRDLVSSALDHPRRNEATRPG